jgi:hypothetical protein
VSSFEIRHATEVTTDLVSAFARLIPQLSSSSPPPTAADLRAIVDAPDSVLFLAVDIGDTGDTSTGDTVIGSLTLACYRMPTGVKAWI